MQWDQAFKQKDGYKKENISQSLIRLKKMAVAIIVAQGPFFQVVWLDNLEECGYTQGP